MEFALDYLQSSQLNQDLAQMMPAAKADDWETARQKMTYALLRWHQWLENPYVDRDAVNLRRMTSHDFAAFRSQALALFGKHKVDYISLSQFDNLVFEFVQNAVAKGPNRAERLAKLATMAATEYHGFNAVYTDSIKKHGLNPNAKFHDGGDINEIFQIWHKTTDHVDHAEADQNRISVTPDPDVAYRHALISPEWFSSFNLSINLDNLGNALAGDRLNSGEKQHVQQFFNYWWDKLATNENPKIAIIPMFRNPEILKNRINFNLKYLERWGEKEGLQKLLTGPMFFDYEHLYTEPIPPELIQIVEIKTNNALSQHLSRIKAEFNAKLAAQNALQQNFQQIKDLHLGLDDLAALHNFDDPQEQTAEPQNVIVTQSLEK